MSARRGSGGPGTELRRPAEARAREHIAPAAADLAGLTPEAARRLLHELQVHQIELEAQNEELRRTQGELEAVRARYFDLYDLAPVGYFTVSAAGLILEANLTLATLLGVDRGALVRQPLRRFILPEDQEACDRHVRALVETGVPQGCEVRLRRAGAADFWARLEGTAARAEDGTPLYRAAVSDISEQRRAQAALGASEAQLRLITDNAHDTIWLMDLDLRMTWISPSVTRQRGFTLAELRALPLERQFTPESAARVRELQARLLSRERLADPTYELSLDVELEVCRKDGSTFWSHLTVTLLRDRLGQPDRLLGVGRDVTERRQAEARFRAVFDRAAEGMLLTDLATRRFEMANPAMCRLLGYSRDELLRLRVEDIHPPEALPLIDAAAATLARGQPAADAELPMKRHDGTVFFAEVGGGLLVLDGRTFMMGCYRDVTERRRLQADLAQADRLASMGMLAAGVAHEINNPLAYVLFNVESLAQDLPRLTGAAQRCAAALRDHVGDEGVAAVAGDGAELLEPAALADAADRAREALEGAQRIREIARSLGTFSRVEQAELAAVDLNTVVEHAATMAHNEIRFRARLVKDLGPVPAVRASAGKLAQVFVNLLVNAAHAIDEGAVERNRITLRTWAEAGEVLAEVADTGVGIPPENLERVFEPFFSTKKLGQGSGLGLSICRTLLAGFGGAIRVESKVGTGTRFVVRLPALREAPAAATAAPAPAAEPVTAARGRILVVDDEEQIRRSLQRLLGTAHEVVAAASGAEARARLEQDQDFDVILCDLMMPELSGMDLHAWLAEAHPALAAKVVFISGGAFTPRGAEYMARVGNLRIEKPFDAGKLVMLVADLVAAARGGA
jgi:PAS domain S-box-containing protein